MATHASRTPRWYAIPFRVLLATFIGTLLCFAVTLLFAILGTVITAKLRSVHPDMRIAYRYIALPVAAVAGAIIFVLSLIMEIRHYRQSKALAAIERISYSSEAKQRQFFSSPARKSNSPPLPKPPITAIGRGPHPLPTAHCWSQTRALQ